MSTVEEIKQKLDIVEVVGAYAALAKAGRNFKALCPFHSEKTPSFFVFPERQSWHCFGACNTGGDIFTFVMKKEGLGFGEALRLLADKAGIILPSRVERGPDRDARERLFQANEIAAQYYHSLLVAHPDGERAKRYLLERGLTPKSIADFQLGFSPDAWEVLKLHLLERGFTEAEQLAVGLLIQAEGGRTHDRFRNRLMFPIRDGRGRVTGFSGRVLDASLPKYMNSPQTPVFDKSATIYGIDVAAPAIRREDMVVIVEGYMDVIIAHQYDFGNVVASMGTAITAQHINILKKLTKNVVLALDADAAGEEAMLRCVDYENSLGAEVRVIILPGEKDPDEVIRENPARWREMVTTAVPVIEFTIDRVVARLDVSRVSDKSTASNRLLPLIARVSDDIRRDHYLTRLSKLIGISYNRLEDILKGYIAAPQTARGGARKPPPKLVVASAREENCLALLLHHPELKTQEETLLPEYFQDSQNREIFTAWLETDDLMALKERLDPALQEKVDEMAAQPPPSNRLTERYRYSRLLLMRDYLVNREAIRKEIFSQEVEVGGKGADLARLEQEGIEISSQLKKVFVELEEVMRRARQW